MDASTTSTALLPNAEKLQEIEQVLASASNVEWTLRELALTPGGLVNDEIRKMVWPKLVGVTLDTEQDEDDDEAQQAIRDETRRAEEAAAAATPWTAGSDEMELTTKSSSWHSTKHSNSSPKSMEGDDDDNAPMNHDDEYDASSVGSEETSTTLSSRVDVDTIERDVLRCTTHLLPPQLLPHVHDGRVRKLLRNQQERLAHLINKVLIHNDQFWYYQGYHDISSVFLSTLGGKISLRKDWQLEHGDDVLPYEVLSKVSKQHYADFLHNNFGHLQTTLKLTVFPLLARFDIDVHDLLFQIEVPCSFCLSWILTWFSRESGPYTHRVFDALLSSHPLLPLYLSVAIVTHPHNRQLILQCEPDFSILHHLLKSLPQYTFGMRKHDNDDEYYYDEWMDDDDNSVWDNKTVDEAWLRQKIAEPHSPHHHCHHTPSSSPHTPSSSSRSISTSSNEVLAAPFDEILQNALEYMRIVPPHQLLDLAERYYRIYGMTTHNTNQNEWNDLLSDVSEIHFFRPSHRTTLLSTTGPPPNPLSLAYIAAGYAEGSQKRKKRRQQKRRRRQKRMAMAVAVAIVILGILIKKYQQQHSKPALPPQSKPRPTAASSTNATASSRQSSIPPLQPKSPTPVALEGVPIVQEVDRHDLPNLLLLDEVEEDGNDIHDENEEE